MKNAIKVSVSLILVLVFAFSLASCNSVKKEGLWENAEYRKDMEFGEGAITVTVEVEAGENKVAFTLHTDKTLLSEALLEHGLITAEDGPYGLYVTHVNGIHASDDDRAYWALYINGEYGLTGVSTTPITEGTVYKLAYETY